MVKVQLPDGSLQEYPDGSTSYDVAAKIGPRLAQACVAASVDGTIWVANELSSSVSKVVPGTAAPQTIGVEGRPISLSVVGSKIIVSLAGR